MPVEKWVSLVAALLLMFVLLFSGFFGKQKKHNDDYSAEAKVSTAGVFFDIASAEDRLVEMEVDIKYQRYGDNSHHFVLSTDEAGDRAFATVLIAYRTAAREIPFYKLVTSQLITEKGDGLLQERAWEEIVRFNNSSYEPVRIVGVNIKRITPDPDPESAGRPTMFFLNEESGDAKVGI